MNVAARLEQAAAPGEILLGEATYPPGAGRRRRGARRPLELKGKARARAAYRLLGVDDGRAGAPRRLESPLVGREPELDRLEQPSSRIAEHGVRACDRAWPAGVGKSQARSDEFVPRLDAAAACCNGRCLPYGEGITFWPVAEVVKEGCRDRSSDDPRARQGDRSPRCAEATERDATSSAIAAAIGLSETSPAAPRRRSGRSGGCSKLAARRPLVVVFDDIHWGEATFLDLLEYLAAWSRDRDARLLHRTAGAARPAPGLEWAAADAAVTLRAADRGRADGWSRTCSGGADRSTQRRTASGAAEGNPLFIEEMLRMLVDDGLIARDDGRWRPTASLSELAVPPTIHALLAAR